MRNLIAAMFFATVSAMGQAASFQSITYSTSGAVVPGKWTAQYSAAKTKARNNNAPLVAVWVNPDCTYCKSLGSVLGSSVSKWAEQRGYYLAIGILNTTTEASAIKTFVANSTGLFPYVGVWWPKKTGGEVKVKFSGRSGTMPVKSGSLAQQFMDSVDKYVGSYSGAGTPSGGGTTPTPSVSTFTVTFDANGGTVSEKTRSVKSGKTVGTLPTPTYANHRFDGWFTASSGGTKISSSTAVTKAVTFYAHWTQLYPLSVDIMPNAGDGRVSGTGSYASGTEVKLTATPTSGRVFSGWYSGKTLLTQEKTCAIVMPSGSAHVTAKFIKKTDDWVKIGVFKVADEYETKKEIVPIALSATGGSLPTLSVSKLPSGLKFTAKALDVKATSKTPAAHYEANTIYGTPTKSGIYSAQITAKTAGGAKASAILPLVVRAKNERIVKVYCDTAKGKVSGGGVFADGKKASVRATALSKQCFTGWSIGGTLVSRSTSYSYPVDGKDVTLVAGFVSKEDDLNSVSLAVAGKMQAAAAVVTNVVRAGVQLKLPVVASAKSGTSVTTSGLPSGLKLVKTLVNKELKEYAYEISGAPSSASKVNSKTGLVKPTVAKIKVTTLGKNTVTYQYAFVIEALPVWAYGNFSGFAAADWDGAGVGAASLTVSSAGKISGKFTLFGTNWTYSVTGYASCGNPDDPIKGKFRIEAVAKKSKLQLPFVAEVTPGIDKCSIVSVDAGNWLMTLHRKVWSDKPALPSPKLAKTALVEFGYDNLAVSVSSSGAATFAGKLNNGTKVSSTSSLVFINEDGLYQTYLIVPWSKTFGGYIDEINLNSLK